MRFWDKIYQSLVICTPVYALCRRMPLPPIPEYECKDLDLQMRVLICTI
jgi:hypothetical protein